MWGRKKNESRKGGGQIGVGRKKEQELGKKRMRASGMGEGREEELDDKGDEVYFPNDKPLRIDGSPDGRRITARETDTQAERDRQADS